MRRTWRLTGAGAMREAIDPRPVTGLLRLMIEASHLSKRFHDRKAGEIVAVDHISFTCKPGEIYGLLGVNGAGKTTLLRMLATLLKPGSGSARVAGYDVREAPQQVRASLGFLAASTALYGRLTARETIVYFGRLHGLAESVLAGRVKHLADELDLHPFLDRRVETFSTGMKQRTSIARTLVHDPAVIILDEPTLGLDVLAARTIVRFVEGCRERRKTVIYSTHIMSEAEKLCDRIGILHRGRLLEEGSPAGLRERHGARDLEEVFVGVAGAGEAA